MEEDIKILEEKLKEWEPYKNIKWLTPIEEQIALENQAIENLIARYKELEEGKALTKKQEAMILKTIKQSAEEQITKEMKNYISKSKVKEKIEEYKTMYNNLPKNPKEHPHSKIEYQIVIGVLQELLED